MMECLSKSKLRIWGDILIHLGVFIQVIYSFRLLFQASLDLGEVELNGSNSVISSTLLNKLITVTWDYLMLSHN